MDIKKMKKTLMMLMNDFSVEERLSVIMTALDYTLATENMTIEDILKVRKEVINEVGECDAWLS